VLSTGYRMAPKAVSWTSNRSMNTPDASGEKWLALRVLYFRIQGDLDISTFEQTVTEYPIGLISNADALMIDLSEITFLDCSGLRQLIEMCRMAQRNGCPVAMITGGNTSVHRITSVLSVESSLPMYRDYAGGIRALLRDSKE